MKKNYQNMKELLLSTLPDLSVLSHLIPLGGGARGESWFENPRLLARHHRRRHRARVVRRQMRRTRRVRGQNLRTGGHRK